MPRSDGEYILASPDTLLGYRITTFAQLDRILDRCSSFWWRNNLIMRGVRAATGEQDVFDLELCALISEIGPLTPYAREPWGRLGGRACFIVTADRHEFWTAVASLGETWRMLKSRPAGVERTRLANKIEDSGLRVLEHEMRVVPRFRDCDFGYDVVPTTLRALLWERVFRVFDRSFFAVCPYCGETFPSENPSGRSYTYCPAHRTAACRQAVHKRRAPASEFTGRFNLTNRGLRDD